MNSVDAMQKPPAPRQQKLLQRWQDMTLYENELHQQGICLIAGVDEAGRGPLAGPVVAAAVILPENVQILGLNDSKKLSEAQRLRLEEQIREKALGISWSAVDAAEIDRINILEAARLAMQQAITKLNPQPQHILTDAMQLHLPIPETSIVRGDSLSVSIAAASIIAKNTRDRMMIDFDKEYPQYGFARHKGYPTAAHKQALQQHGPCAIHRRSFKLV